jgi:hypothetical protein
MMKQIFMVVVVVEEVNDGSDRRHWWKSGRTDRDQRVRTKNTDREWKRI